MANVHNWLRPVGILAVWAGGPLRTPESVSAITVQEFADRWNRFRDRRLAI